MDTITTTHDWFMDHKRNEKSFGCFCGHSPEDAKRLHKYSWCYEFCCWPLGTPQLLSRSERMVVVAAARHWPDCPIANADGLDREMWYVNG